MPDTIPGNRTTTASIGVGGLVQGSLEFGGDHDWYAVNLTAGQQIAISLFGSGPSASAVSDPYLNLWASNGTTLLAHNDDSGATNNSKIVFTAPATGTYYIDAGAWDTASLEDGSNRPNGAPSNTITGNYGLSVQPYTPPPLWTYDQIATQLTTGYWNVQEGNAGHHFNVTQGGTITVNYSTLTAAEQTLARTALAEWSDIIGVTFQPVTSGGQIRFDDSEDPSGPVAQTDWLNTYAHIQISSSWVTGPKGYGTTLNSYSFQSYLHEIGHALGLGHSGNYNGDADYVQDALFSNDAWSTTIMSYFSPRDNSYFAAQNFSDNFSVTPMGADIVAMQALYGLSTTTRTGNTTYGYNSNAGGIYDATLYSNVAYTVFDSGGNDTLDYSAATADQSINLNPETFSNVLGSIGNVSIARGTVIENAIGGAGSDLIVGNDVANVLTGNGSADTLIGGGGDDFLAGGAGNDILTGGPGNDTFSDTMTGFLNDRITDFGPGDKIIITDASLPTFTFHLSGTTLTYNGFSLNLDSAPTGTISASAAPGGHGVQLTLIAPDPGNDFNGDGRSDILWRDDSGLLTSWLANANGSLSPNNNATVSVSLDWQVAGIADFNGDGREDVLWRNSSGALTDWLGNAAGNFTPNSANAAVFVPADWHVVGTGDFNGDGRSDILWRNTGGLLTDWLGNAAGGFATNGGNATADVATDWAVVGTGDFNGDGRDDILWRHVGGQLTDWMGTASGGFIPNSANFSTFVATDWTVAGTGDFNGDGSSDILWRNSSGQLTDWLGTSSGGFTVNSSNMSQLVSTSWHIASTGDFNGDGRDDIIWRNDDGQMTEWLGTSTGGFVDNSVNASSFVATHWHIEHTPATLF